MSTLEDKLNEQAENLRQSEEEKLDETVPGGRFKVGDRIVNCDGEPVKGAGGAKSRVGARGEEAEEEEDDLESLTVPELKDRAAGLEIEGTSTMLKGDLVKAIKRAEKKAGA